MQKRILQKFLVAAFAAILFSTEGNAANIPAVKAQHELQVCKIPPAIQEAYNAFIQKFGTPTSGSLVSWTQQGNVYTVVALLNFSYGAKKLTATFTRDGSVLYYTLK